MLRKAAIRSGPCGPSDRAAPRASAASTSSSRRMRRAGATAFSPAAVGLAPRRPRSKRTAPILRSLPRTEWETADWVRPSATAAAEKPPVSATATRTRSS